MHVYAIAFLGRYAEAVLCDKHAKAQRALGREPKLLTHAPEADRNATCDDCDARKWDGPSVLDRVIAQDDAAKAADEPKPVPVLPGQKRLFE